MNVAYLNGEKCSNLNQISLYNPSFLYGINVFEGIRSYWNGEENLIFDLDQHLKRLFISADFLGFNVKYSVNDIEDELNKVFESEKIKENVYIRITFFIESETTWSEQNNIAHLISIRSMQSFLGKNEATALAISSFTRISSKSMPPSIKAGANYLNSRYALLEAKRKGYDGALFLSEKNIIAESTGSCIFFIREGKVYTPSENSDILVGVTRNRIIYLCRTMDIEVMETEISPATVYTFDAAFLAGTMIEIKPISQIEAKRFQTITNPTYNSIVQMLISYVHGK
jgi:branched-chain amino acid aminotransferase